MLEKFLIWVKQKRCKHKYRKHYNKDKGFYVMRCMRCEKEIERDEGT